MQGLRPYVQDENALAGLHRTAGLKAAPGLGGDLGLGGPRKLASGSSQPGARKALGNITNRGGFDAENLAPGKTPGAAPVPARRALGDITNSKAAPPSSLRPTAQKPAAVQPQQATQQVAQHASAAAALASRADALAAHGVEKLAGKGWEALERDRLAREDADIDRRLAAIANYRPLPNFFPLWSMPSMEQALQKDVLPTPPASPPATKLRTPAGTAPFSDLSLPELGDPALVLPNIALPDIDIDNVLSMAGMDDL